MWCFFGYVFGVQIPNLRRWPWMSRVRLWRYLLARKPQQKSPKSHPHRFPRTCLMNMFAFSQSKKWHTVWLDSLRPQGIIFSTNCIGKSFFALRLLQSTLNLTSPQNYLTYLLNKCCLEDYFPFKTGPFLVDMFILRGEIDASFANPTKPSRTPGRMQTTIHGTLAGGPSLSGCQTSSL